MKKRLICGMAAAVLALSGGGAVVGNVACLWTDIAASAADADYENEDYVYTIKASGVIIKEYVGDSTTVNIPSKIDGVAVVDIAKGAFLRKNVEKVAVPSTVKTLESRVFEKCQNLKFLTQLHTKSHQVTSNHFSSLGNKAKP